jgi:N-acetylneuraminate synthase/N,N'-diacetyllegionaminate synthase
MKSPWEGKFGPLLIAEIGGNHLGDFEYAMELANLAIDTNVDYVKFQMYQGDTLVSRFESPDRNKHFKTFELLKEEYIALAELCQAHGIGYLASVWDAEFLDWIDDYMSIYKIGSGDLTAYPIISKIAEKKKPIILSTGLSTLEEVLDAVAYIRSVDKRYEDPNYLALLQCTSMYPIQNSDANLDVMDTLRKATGLTVGYSDHTEGTKALFVAAARGAQILEFHFTNRREGQWFRDHKVSITPDEVRALQAEISAIKELRGNGIKRPLDCEAEHLISFRRAVYPTQNIKAGERLTADKLMCLRPNHGIDAREFTKVLNKTARVDLQAYQTLEWEMLNADSDL